MAINAELIQDSGAVRRDPANVGTLVVEDDNHFRVHTRAYTDEEVFKAEMERIFSKAWIFLGHESELPHVGDFKTAYIGLQPVILTHGEDGQFHVVLNRCVHRGAVVTREAQGNATEFNCPYHGWVYALDGKLIAVSERNEAGGYSKDFDQPEGLYRAPHVDSYRGLIFASLNPDVQPLEQYLGRAKALIDRKFDLSPTGRISVRGKPYVMRYQGNWKFQTENIVDAYHFMHTHKGFVALQAKYGDSTGDFGVHKGGSAKVMRKLRFKGISWSLPNGHGQIEVASDKPESFLNGAHSAYYRALHEKIGEDAFASIVGKSAGTIFPTMGLIHQQLRTWRPIAPDMTEVTVYLYDLEGVPAEINDGMMRSQERFYGPAGHGMVDDVDIFARNQQGLAGIVSPWLILERGLDTDERLDSGEYQGLPASEAPQRALWREWKKLMVSGQEVE